MVGGSILSPGTHQAHQLNLTPGNKRGAPQSLKYAVIAAATPFALSRNRSKMFSKTTIALSTAILLGTAFAASATEPGAPKHHRASHVQNQPIYNMVPDNRIPADNAAYPASRAPLRTQPDGW